MENYEPMEATVICGNTIATLHRWEGKLCGIVIVEKGSTAEIDDIAEFVREYLLD